jgi:hypothetical protein
MLGFNTGSEGPNHAANDQSESRDTWKFQRDLRHETTELVGVED